MVTLHNFLSGCFILSSVCFSEAITYYVSPTEPPNSDCPGEPCQTLNYYFSHGDRYFSSDKVIVTMIFLHGEHALNKDHNSSFDDLSDNTYFVDDLERFEMIGMELAHEIVVHLSTHIWLRNVTTTYVGSLTLIMKAKDYIVLNLPGYDSRTYLRQSSETAIPVDRKIFVTIVNETHFNGVVLYQYTIKPVNFSILVANAIFSNQSAISCFSAVDQDNEYYIRQLKVTGCTFSNSFLQLNYATVKIIVEDSTIIDNTTFSEDTEYSTIVHVLYSNIEIAGTVLFTISSTTNGLAPFSFLSSNVTIIGDVTFANNKVTPIAAYSSIITLSGSVSFLSNTGTKGGAMALHSSTLNIASNTIVYFYNNTATETGGAIYVTNDDNKFLGLPNYTPCFYQLLDYGEDNWYDIQFVNNSAQSGGDHIYGVSMHSDTCYAVAEGFDIFEPVVIFTYCVQMFFTYFPESISSVSSDPTRVCICDAHGQPQCTDSYVKPIKIHPGETFTIPAVVVGADLGTTIGTVHTVFENPRSSVVLKPTSQYIQGISNNKICSQLNYSIFSWNTHEIVYLTVKEESLMTVRKYFTEGHYGYISTCNLIYNEYVKQATLSSPPLLNVTFLPCPPGFTLLGDPPGCDCYPLLIVNKIDCKLTNRKGYHSWSGPMWLDIDINSTVFLAQ